eukprot:scaffold1724_cov341-Pavlova_lutheri.AAC.74
MIGFRLKRSFTLARGVFLSFPKPINVTWSTVAPSSPLSFVGIARRVTLERLERKVSPGFNA